MIVNNTMLVVKEFVINANCQPLTVIAFVLLSVTTDEAGVTMKPLFYSHERYVDNSAHVAIKDSEKMIVWQISWPKTPRLERRDLSLQGQINVTAWLVSWRTPSI